MQTRATRAGGAVLSAGVVSGERAMALESSRVAPDDSRAGSTRVTVGEGVLEPELERSGPLDSSRARALLSRADQLLAGGEFPDAARYYQRLIGATSDPVMTAAALYGLGMALFRMDREDAARATWEQVLSLPETPFTYRAWREIAGMRVRDRDLAGAQRAYREAERRAPAEDRAEIASRLGWLAKETGDVRGAS